MHRVLLKGSYWADTLTQMSLLKGLLNGYVKAPQILEEIDDYIVPPSLGKQSGVLGAIALVYQSNR